LPAFLTGAVKFGDKFEKLSTLTTQQYLDANFVSAHLKAILASQWGDYGVPPAKSPFVLHAVIVNHYFGGGFYPRGGSKTIADSIVPVIKARGGDCLVNQRVTEIIVENGVCKGVKSIDNNQKEVVFLAPTVVSDAGVATTFGDLVPSAYRKPKSTKQDKDICTCLTLYLGLKTDPRTLGFEGENHWIYRGYDHNQTYAKASEVVNGQTEFCYLSFPSLKDPEARQATAEIITFCDYAAFSEWENSSWKHRGQSYEELKEKMSVSMIDLVESRFPGFRDLIDFQELSTPLTVRDFTGHTRGAIYGEPSTLENFRRKTFDPRTQIKNLYLTGADVVTSGVMGALMGGVVTASHYLGGFSGFMRLMSAAKATQSKQAKHSKQAAKESALAK
jgi:all-trans-retinol 13,14-reductase